MSTRMPISHPHTHIHRTFEMYSNYRLQVEHVCQHCKCHGRPIGGHENSPLSQTQGHRHHAEPGFLVGSDYIPHQRSILYKFQLDITSVIKSLHDELPSFFTRWTHGTDMRKLCRKQWQYLLSMGQTPNAKKSNEMNKNSEQQQVKKTTLGRVRSEGERDHQRVRV